VGKPRGHGVLEITSADPRAPPRIESRLLVDARDRDAMVDAIALAFALSQERAISALARPLIPSPRRLRTRESIAAVLPRFTDSGYHPCGTVPMGRDSDPAAALDSRGRVRGAEGLIVADASILPTIPSANTNLTTLMIGERFGEWARAAP
jgi:choline dehydrogenase